MKATDFQSVQRCADHPLPVGSSMRSLALLSFMMFISTGALLGQGYAVRFDGVDDFVRLTDGAEVIQRPAYTIEAWVRVPPGHGYGVVYAESTSCGPSMHITLHSDGSVRFNRKTLDPGPFMWVESGPGSVPVDAWTHICATYDLSVGASLYLNGQLVAQNNDTRTDTIAGQISKSSLGASWAPCAYGAPGYTEFIRGDIAELRLWSVARQAAAIQASMSIGSVTGNEPGLIAMWALDEFGQQTIHDAAASRTAYLGFSPVPDAHDPTWVFVGPPVVAAVTQFGAGCVGSSGIPSLAPLAGSMPRIGQAFALRLTNLPITGFFVVAVPFLGFDTASSGGVPLPRDLGPIGMPGCTQYVDPFQSSFLFTPTGSVDWPLAIPNVPAFAGIQVHFQAAIVDLPINQLGLTATNAVTATLGW